MTFLSPKTIGRIVHASSLALTFLACGTVSVRADGDPAASATNSLELARVILALPAGAPWLNLASGLLCIARPATRTWPGGRVDQELSPYAVSFKAEMERAGYKVITRGQDNLFEEQAGAADYQVAGVITEANIDACVSNGELLTEKGDVRGDGALKMDWQVYSPIRKQVVARLSTSGTAHLGRNVPGGVTRLIAEAFASN